MAAHRCAFAPASPARGPVERTRGLRAGQWNGSQPVHPAATRMPAAAGGANLPL